MAITVVGGGISGLVAASELAERGAVVLLRERRSHLGGRARTAGPPFRTNFGPHALYADGPLWRWLDARGLLPPAKASNPLTVRFVLGGRVRRLPPAPVLRAMRLAGRPAPADRPFRAWAAGHLPAGDVGAVCRLASFFTFAADPGALSARFVNERLARLVRPPSPARFVGDGGWGAIVDRLEGHVRGLGVDVRLGDRVDELPEPPVVVALELPAASSLLGEPLDAPSVDAALLDVALDGGRPGPSAVIDLDGGAFVERYTAFDRGLAPPGHHLLQAHAGLAPGEGPAAAVGRIEAALDLAHPGWRAREVWRAVRRSEGRSGAVELPDVPWSSRPAIERRPGVLLVGDAVAAPGLLAEVGVVSAVQAAEALAR